MLGKSRLRAVIVAFLGLLLLGGILAGLGIAGAYNSDSSGRIIDARSTPTPSPEPDTDGDTEPTSTPSTGPTPTLTPVPGSTATPEPDPTATTDPGVKHTPTLDPIPTPGLDPTPTAEPTPTLHRDPPAEPTPTLKPDAGGGDEPLVEPDPDYEAALDRARFFTFDWDTDFSLHSVPYDEIRGGGVPQDGIPPIDNPKFVTAQEADDWLGDREPVIALEIDGDVRAYPLQILTWHEIVNDEVGGVPVSVTFCPLCNAAIVFDRRLDGVVYDFGTSGNLRNSDLIMWDRQTQSWWQQFSGEAIVGTLTGRKLTFLPSSIVSFGFFKEAYPDVKVLSRDTGFSRSYGRNPYAGYDRADNPPFLFDGVLDGRLLPKERVAAVTVGEVDLAFPFSVLEQERVVNYKANGQDLVVFFVSGTASALDQSSIQDSRDVGSTGVFDPVLDGEKLTFKAEGDTIIDNETGSVWNILGEAVEGPLTGERLTPLVHADHFWFAWAAFKPDTLIYQGQG